MRKITFLILTFLAFQFGNAQQIISFESSEGYALGDINGQNSWVTTGDGAGGFVVNQTVTSEAATDGTNSLKIAQDNRFDWQEEAGPIIGGFYEYASPIPYQSAVISLDVYINDEVGEASDYRLGTVSMTAGFYTSLIDFAFDGKLYVLINDDFVELTETWNSQTWYNFKIEMTATTITYYIDDVVASQGALGADQRHDIEELRFVHDNYSDIGFAYLDNFRTNNEPLSLDDVAISSFEHYFNKDTGELTLSSSSSIFDAIELYNNLGQSVMKKSLSKAKEVVNFSNLQDGVYLAEVTIEGRSKTIKFLKQ